MPVSSPNATGLSRNSPLTPSRASRITRGSVNSPGTAVTPAGKWASFGERVSARTCVPAAARC